MFLLVTNHMEMRPSQQATGVHLSRGHSVVFKYHIKMK